MHAQAFHFCLGHNAGLQILVFAREFLRSAGEVRRRANIGWKIAEIFRKIHACTNGIAMFATQRRFVCVGTAGYGESNLRPLFICVNL